MTLLAQDAAGSVRVLRRHKVAQELAVEGAKHAYPAVAKVLWPFEGDAGRAWLLVLARERDAFPVGIGGKHRLVALVVLVVGLLGL
eukprot:scaffold116046_cov67-Phaeocystis_antarctica.AAC.1